MSKAFTAITVGTDPIDLTKYDKVIQLIPTEIYHKSNGDLDNKDSFCIVMRDSVGGVVCGQISLKMLNDELKDIGFELARL